MGKPLRLITTVLGMGLITTHQLHAAGTPPRVSARQASSKPTEINPTGVTGTAGGGYANFTIKTPADTLRVDRGVFAALSVERGFGVMNSYLTLSLNYMNTTGQAKYDYTTLAGTRYQVSDVAFQANLFQAGLGLKVKLIDGYWFRPYIEGGGLGGYYQIRYTTKETQMKTTGSDYKTTDAVMDAGYYGEAGLEVAFSDSFGIRASARYASNTTAEVETLNKEEIRYEAQVYYLAILATF